MYVILITGTNLYYAVMAMYCGTDMNECELGTDECTQRCTNTEGSYTCQCNDGYTLDSDMKTCTGNGQLNVNYK